MSHMVRIGDAFQLRWGNQGKGETMWFNSRYFGGVEKTEKLVLSFKQLIDVKELERKNRLRKIPKNNKSGIVGLSIELRSRKGRENFYPYCSCNYIENGIYKRCSYSIDSNGFNLAVEKAREKRLICDPYVPSLKECLIILFPQYIKLL